MIPAAIRSSIVANPYKIGSKSVAKVNVKKIPGQLTGDLL